jgi:hypothetical protein
MGSIRRAINLIVALTLTVAGCGGLVYLVFFAAAWKGGMAIAAAVIGFAGLYWLWAEYINSGSRPEN